MLKLQAIGYLGRDAQVNVVNGHSVVNFSLAHTERWKDKEGQPKEKTIWLDCAYWTLRTGLAEQLKKGCQVFVEGLPESRAYLNADHQAASTLVLRVSQLELLQRKDDPPSRITYEPQMEDRRPSHFSNGQNGQALVAALVENPVAAAARRRTNPLA